MMIARLHSKASPGQVMLVHGPRHQQGAVPGRTSTMAASVSLISQAYGLGASTRPVTAISTGTSAHSCFRSASTTGVEEGSRVGLTAVQEERGAADTAARHFRASHFRPAAIPGT